MELFALGVFDAGGQPNYTEDDVKQLAKALSGFVIDDTDPNNAVAPLRALPALVPGPKAVLGESRALEHEPAAPSTTCSTQPTHAPYLVKRLWARVHRPAARRGDARRPEQDATSTAATSCKPLLKQDPHPPAAVRVDRRAEHDQAAGRVRRRHAPRARATGSSTAVRYDYLDDDGPGARTSRRPWRAGSTGRAWLNTNTALARFAFAGRDGGRDRGRSRTTLVETPQGAFERAHAAVGSPWLPQPRATR